MKNPFSKIATSNTDREKGRLQKAISNQALTITKHFAIGICTTVDIDVLDDLYKEYFKKYPNKDSEANSRKRIMQLRGIIK